MYKARNGLFNDLNVFQSVSAVLQAIEEIIYSEFRQPFP